MNLSSREIKNMSKKYTKRALVLALTLLLALAAFSVLAFADDAAAPAP